MNIDININDKTTIGELKRMIYTEVCAEVCARLVAELSKTDATATPQQPVAPVETLQPTKEKEPSQSNRQWEFQRRLTVKYDGKSIELGDFQAALRWAAKDRLSQEELYHEYNKGKGGSKRGNERIARQLETLRRVAQRCNNLSRIESLTRYGVNGKEYTVGGGK